MYEYTRLNIPGSVYMQIPFSARDTPVSEFAVILEKDDFHDRDKLFYLFREYREEIRTATEHEWKQANITMGLAVYDPEMDSSVIDVARRADQAMYENKRLRKEKQRSKETT